MESSADLKRLGWSDYFAGAFDRVALKDQVPGRVVIALRGVYGIATANGEMRGELRGKLRKQRSDRSRLPVVGDWVAARLYPQEQKAAVEAVLPRRTWISRKAAGLHAHEQMLAANIDTLFILAGLDHDLNLRRLERMLAIGWDGGAEPVVVLTKADLCPDPQAQLARAVSACPGVKVLLVSAVDGQGISQLHAHLQPGKTVACLGPSGVGKSTLVNHLAGEELLAVQDVRESDSKGRHTTSHRELVVLPGGGMVIDTPGLREIGLWEGEGGVETVFPDIASLSVKCRFRDCRHLSEPDCAIRSAVDRGELDAARVTSYQKLMEESRRLSDRHWRRPRN